ncbi:MULTISPECIES: EamA family transporter RarD [unclassified Arthrobacter]|uniref:EamA family transporter RarD n=1 Tax=unclassified Arthrobacter TaxID=235627 RepID=UPI00031F553F|nr:MULTISPECIES: EamA family transporter RarD [unclassified Arthrobacter]PVE15672.1 EamA family transporter RarD [Arthrobacter sp. Bz4]
MTPTDITSPRQPRSENSTGILYGIGAYGLWGLLPLYFMILLPATAIEIVANRVLWSLVFCALLLTVMRSWRTMWSAASNPRILGTLAIAALLIAVNWFVYTYGVTNGHAIEAALGYFINPIVSVLLGVVVLREKLRRLQWAAVGVGIIAVVVLAIGYGNVPWIALTLAFSFGFYGFVKKRVGSKVGALSSLSIETAVLTPIAGAVMIWLTVSGSATVLTEGPAHFWIMAAAGIITAVPLLFFGAAARRLPLTTIGLLQYLAPVLQFLLALFVFQEEMPLERWIGFGLVWIALSMLTVDMLHTVRKNSRPRRSRDATPVEETAAV